MDNYDEFEIKSSELNKKGIANSYNFSNSKLIKMYDYIQYKAHMYEYMRDAKNLQTIHSHKLFIYNVTLCKTMNNT